MFAARNILPQHHGLADHRVRLNMGASEHEGRHIPPVHGHENKKHNVLLTNGCVMCIIGS